MNTQDALSQFENAEITELDEGALEGVAGGGAIGNGSNGNCSCPAGTPPPTGFDNGNCSCSGGREA